MGEVYTGSERQRRTRETHGVSYDDRGGSWRLRRPMAACPTKGEVHGGRRRSTVGSPRCKDGDREVHGGSSGQGGGPWRLGMSTAAHTATRKVHGTSGGPRRLVWR